MQKKSYFKVGSDPSDVDPMMYSILGMVNLFERYKKDEFGILNETKISLISIESGLDNIDLSHTDFWNGNFQLSYEYVKNYTDNSICACSTMLNIFDLSMSGEFDGLGVKLNGRGLFGLEGDAGGIYSIKDSLGFFRD